jgi:hypothetical protein
MAECCCMRFYVFHVMYVGLSRIHSMERQINHSIDQIYEQSEEAPVIPLKSLVSVGSVVAVFTNDSDFDYYLLLVKKKNVYIKQRQYRFMGGV